MYPNLEDAMLDGHFIVHEISYTECQCDGINLVGTI